MDHIRNHGTNKKWSKLDIKCPHCLDGLAFEEVIALADRQSTRLIQGSDLNELNFQINHFLVHNRDGSIFYSLDNSFIEKGEDVFVCGHLLNICDNDISTSSLITVKMIGPLNEWWFSGFDSGSQLLVGIESPYASYLLGTPHPDYRILFEKLNRKMFLTKLVIETIENDLDCDFQALITYLENDQRIIGFNLQFFIESLNFLLEQIKNYDSCRDFDELSLCESRLYKNLEDISKNSISSGMINFTNSNQKSLFQYFKNDQTCSTLNNVNSVCSTKIFEQVLNSLIIRSGSNSDHKTSKMPLSCSNPFKLSSVDTLFGHFIKFKTLDEQLNYGRIIRLVNSDDDSVKMAHLNIFVPDQKTFLGETLAQNVLFATKNCLDLDITRCSMLEIINVRLMLSFPNENHNNMNISNDYICFQIHDQKRCVFESLPLDYLAEKTEDEHLKCFGCSTNILENLKMTEHFSIGDCVLFSCDSHKKPPVINYFDYAPTEFGSYDKDKFPEKIRKKPEDSLKDNYELSDYESMYTIGYVKEINSEENCLKLNLFYRPQNIILDFETFLTYDLNVLFWTELVCDIHVSSVFRKCTVIHLDSPESANQLFKDNEEFFYFNLCYNPVCQEFYTPPDFVIRNFNLKQSPQPKCKQKKLKILDLFAGCGGLSYGFASLASKLYAIEKEKSAAESYKMNYPSSTVYNSDANLILKMLIDENRDEFLFDGLPESIDLIICGAPCQGFTEMNRYSYSDCSILKRSSVVCFMNFVEHYKPKYFLLENVPNMIHYGKSLIFKTFCSFMIRIGYQLRIAILQVGCYGLPQNRKRLFVIGAQSSCRLPRFPLPTHSFSRKKSKMSFNINEHRFEPFDLTNRIFRMVTIQDSIGDLVDLHPESYFLDIARPYKLGFKDCSYYQKILRKNDQNKSSLDHYCKELSLLNIERIKHIPFEPGADWRDLPNVQIQLPNGSLIRKLEYHQKNRNRIRNRKQKNTLIPWCLANTANKNQNWPGLYGRLWWKGHFPTIVTDPDPITMQGRIIHPDQHRVLSIREMARAQGFPDDFYFYGQVHDKYSQIGNAVSPIISTKLAREFIKT